jgi:hypothetical protein
MYFYVLSYVFQSATALTEEELYGEYVSARAEHPTEVFRFPSAFYSSIIALK